MSRERLEPAAISSLERQLLIGAPSNQPKPQIQPVGASPLLSQLKQFLPKMQQANAELQQKLQEVDPSELDIEHISQQGEEQGTVIQMDLACGLLDLHDDAAVAAAQRAIAAGGDITVETYDGGSGSETDSDSDSEHDSEHGSEDGGDMDGEQSRREGNGGKAGSSSKSSAAAAAAASGQGDVVAMDEDGLQEGPAAAAAAGVQQQQQQQEQQQGKQRRKLKAKKPMIVELS